MKHIPLLIVGGGPAGLTAALYAGRGGIPVTLWEASSMPGGQMTTTPEIENFPGVFKTDGFALSEIMKKQALELGAKIETQKAVKFSLTPGHLQIDGERESVVAKTLILAMGVRRRKLGIPGEDRLLGRGVSFCAICDGHFFKGKKVAVAGGGSTALEEALHLAELGCDVTLLHRRESFRGEADLLLRVRKNERITIATPYVLTAVEGDRFVTNVLAKHSQTGKEMSLEVSALFVCVGTVANTELVSEILPLDEEGRILAGETTQTNIPGVYAAGDIRQKPLYQIVTATADGAVAAMKAGEFLGK